VQIGILIPGFSSDSDDWAIPVLRRLAAGLAVRHSVRILALRYPERRARYRIDGVEVTALGAGQVDGWRRLVLWQDALRSLRSLHRERPFDVLHGLWADETGLLTTWAGRELGVRSVVSILGGELVGFHDLGYGLQRSAFSRWIVGQALKADALLSSCTYVDDLIAQAGYRVAPEKLRRVPLGVDTEHFTPGGGYEANRLIHVASLIPVKQQHVMLRALARLAPDVTLDIIGEGPERAPLEALAAALGIAQRVRWLGAVAHLDMPAYYRRAALHVTSTRSETGPLATLEAAACGVPTVGTAVGMLPDHPGLGAAVPVGDAQALADAVRALLTDPARLASARSLARQTALSLDTQAMLKGVQAAYQAEAANAR
jgi:glycosyltransferase involved in cell wall biosynthesis